MAWKATQNLCRCWTRSWSTYSSATRKRRPPGSVSRLSRGGGSAFVRDQRTGWTEPVRLVGIADSVLCIPQRSGLCAIELKLGRATPVVDLGQAVLYHHHPHAHWPQAEEHRPLIPPLLSGPRGTTRRKRAKLVEAEGRLLDLIGRWPASSRTSPNLRHAPATWSRSRSRRGCHHRTRAQLRDLGKRLQREYRNQGVGIELRGIPKVAPASSASRFV
jgi:hypothetical protein